MKNWSLFPIISSPMPFQMAFDEVLFRKMIECRGEALPRPSNIGSDRSSQRLAPTFKNAPILRFYYASEDWVTVGYSHPLEDKSFANGHRVCRRITGGGQVHHGKDLIFSIIAAKEHDESFKSVRESYHRIHLAVKDFFLRRGQELRFYEKDERLPRGGECFAHPIESDLAFENKKIAGGAQKRSLGVLLHQESIQLKNVYAEDILLRELEKSFESIFSIEMESVQIDPDLIYQAEALAKEKYKLL